MFQRDERHTGASPHDGPSSPFLRLLYPAGGRVYSPSIGTDGTVYCGSDDNTLLAVKDGLLRWSYCGLNPDDGDAAPAIDAQGGVYFSLGWTLATPIRFAALDARTGSPRWAFDARGNGPLTIDRSGMIHSPNGGYVTAFEPGGTLAWSYQLYDATPWEEFLYGGAAFSGGNSYIATWLRVNSLESDGTFRWSYVTDDYTTGSLIDTCPVIEPDGMVTVGCSQGDGLLTLNTNGAVAWSYWFGTHGNNCTTPAMGEDGSVYLPTEEVLYCLNRRSAPALRWSYYQGAGLNNSAAVDGDGTVFLNSSDSLHAFASGGALRWSYCLGGAPSRTFAIGSANDIFLGVGEYLCRMKQSNYINLTANVQRVTSAENVVSLSWQYDFNGWDYAGEPVNIYLAAIKTPVIRDNPSGVADALAGGLVFIARTGMNGWYRYQGRLELPTFRLVSLHPNAPGGTMTFNIPKGGILQGNWVFAVAIVRAEAGEFVRNDATPVENSNIFTLQ